MGRVKKVIVFFYSKRPIGKVIFFKKLVWSNLTPLSCIYFKKMAL